MKFSKSPIDCGYKHGLVSSFRNGLYQDKDADVTNKPFREAQAKRWEEAMPFYSKAIACKPDFLPAYFNRANTYYEMSEYFNAQKDIDNIQAVICSTDNYHIDADGVYRFKPERSREFHAANQEKVKRLMTNGYNVIVDNTNICNWEAKPYVVAAVEAEYAVVFIRCEASYGSVHGVPAETVERMRKQMEPLSVANCLTAVAPWEKKVAAVS